MFGEKQTNDAARRIFSELNRLGKNKAGKAEIKAYWNSTENDRAQFMPTKMGSCIYTMYEEAMGLTDTHYYWTHN